MITLERLKQVAWFNEKTGEFYRLSKTNHNQPIGRRMGTINDRGYRLIAIDKRRYRAHHLAWLWVYGYLPKYLDHIDGDKANNRISNLRECTHTENMHNTNLNKLKGFTKHEKTGLFRAKIKFHGEEFSLGYFKTPEEASQRYFMVKAALHGEFYGFRR